MVSARVLLYKSGNRENMWSERVKSVTCGCIMVLFLALSLCIWALYQQDVSPYLRAAIFALMALLFLALGSGVLHCPLGVKVDGDDLIMNRLFHPVRLNRAQIVSHESLSEEEAKQMHRRLGCNGFTGYWGKARHPQKGSCKVHTSRWNELTLIRMRNGEQYLINDCSEIHRFFGE